MLADKYVGLDIHRKTVVATVMDSKGRIEDQVTLGGTGGELTDYLKALPGQKRVAMEACVMWEPLFDAATASGAVVTLSHPNKTRLIAEASLKTDRVDSEALAKLLRLDSLPEAYAPSPEVRRLRRMVRERVFFKNKARSICNHGYYLMMRQGTVYEDGILSLKKKRETLRTLELPELNRTLDALAALEATCKELDREIHEAYLASEEARLLASIPGVGELTAVLLAAFLCPVERFGTIEKACSYAGLVPTIHQSGETLYHGRIRRDSNSLLRWALVEASWVHRRVARGSDLSKVGRRVARRRGKGKGAVASAHQLLRIVYAVLKRRTPYTPQAPERPAALYSQQRHEAVASFRVRGTALEPTAANRLGAR